MENETKITNSLNEFCKSKTTILVAHRLSTVRNADLILVMNQGQIIERGTHDELVKLGGQYAEMAKLQSN